MRVSDSSETSAATSSGHAGPPPLWIEVAEPRVQQSRLRGPAGARPTSTAPARRSTRGCNRACCPRAAVPAASCRAASPPDAAAIVCQVALQRLFGIRRILAVKKPTQPPTERRGASPGRAPGPASATSTTPRARRRSMACRASRTSRRRRTSSDTACGRRSSRACEFTASIIVAPRVDVLLVAGDEQRVAEADQRARNPVAILAAAGHRIHRAESPAVGVVPPLALRAADPCRRDPRSWG